MIQILTFLAGIVKHKDDSSTGTTWKCVSLLFDNLNEATFFYHVVDSVADPDPGSVPFWPLDPGSGMGFFRIPDPKTIFWRALTIFWVISSIILWKFAQIFLFSTSKHLIFFTSLFCCRFWIRDPRSGMGKYQIPGSGINIPDPQHWLWKRIRKFFGFTDSNPSLIVGRK